MSKELRFHPEARIEFRESAYLYRERNPQIAVTFRVSVSDGVRRILQSPLQCPQYLFGTRRCVLHTFPFSIVYLEQPETVIVIAVAHHKRRPGYWKSRL